MMKKNIQCYLSLITIFFIIFTILCCTPLQEKFFVNININPGYSGIVERSPDVSEYDAETIVMLTAIPHDDYLFYAWEGDLSGNTNPANIRMDSDKTVTAVFELISTTDPTPGPTPVPTLDPGENNITVTIGVDNMPEEFIYDKETTPDYFLEYEWVVIFDMDESGSTSAGDFGMDISNSKQPGEIETVGSLLDFRIWFLEYTSDSSAIATSNLDVFVMDNTIVMQIDRAAADGLDQLTVSTPVYFHTSYYDDNIHYWVRDYYPSEDTFDYWTVDGLYFDPVGDAAAPVIDMVKLTLTVNE